MKFGAKDYFEEDFLDYFADKADFLEVQGLRSHNYDFIRKYKLPIVVHAEHHKQGSNPCDPNCKTNLESIRNSQRIADSVNGKKIILHPGKLWGEDSSIQHSIKFVKAIKDNRILMENMIVNKELKAPCADPEEMKMYLEETGKGFIFDLAHAMISANYKGVDQIDYIKKFLKLKPLHFHISGQDIKSLHDEHSALHECDIDWKEILKLYPKDAEVTMEVSMDIQKTAKDLDLIRNVVRKIV